MEKKQETFNSNEFFRRHAPDYNFELDEAALLWTCLRDGHIVKVGKDEYAYKEEQVKS